MDYLIFLNIAALIPLVVLMIWDGFYHHIWRYKLFAHPESQKEHFLHTLRTIWFPFILFLLYLCDFAGWLWWLGVGFVVLDLATVLADLLVEGQSRRFMGGLPQWEYVVHMFVNGLHFASVALIFAIKSWSVWLPSKLGLAEASPYNETLFGVVQALLPGAFLMAGLHMALMHRGVAKKWLLLQNRWFGPCSFWPRQGMAQNTLWPPATDPNAKAGS